jgi:hypothetical protein
VYVSSGVEDHRGDRQESAADGSKSPENCAEDALVRRLVALSGDVHQFFSKKKVTVKPLRILYDLFNKPLLDFQNPSEVRARVSSMKITAFFGDVNYHGSHP